MKNFSVFVFDIVMKKFELMSYLMMKYIFISDKKLCSHF